ncbi:hypothetical protein K2X85_00720 [bacterium]|nr:hypothetical protein [bacterium]
MIERLIVWTVYFIVCMIAIIAVARKKGTVYEFPFLMSASTIGFILPQSLTCCFKRELVADDAYFITMVYGIICHIMGYIGYYNYRTPPLIKRPLPLNPERIYHIGLFQIVIGLIGYILMDIYVYKKPFGLFAKSGQYATEWTGLPVAFEFACKFVFPGAIMVYFAILSMGRPRLYHWLTLSVGLVYPVFSVVLLGRRASVMLVAGVFALPLFYVRKFIPKGYVFLIGAIVMALLVFLLPAYRRYFAYDADKSQILKINPIKVIQQNLEGKETLELPFQMHTVGGIYHTGRYGWGVDFYNSIIKGFVPAMFVSRERKNAMFAPGAEPQESASIVYGQAHSGRNYLAEQGIVDSFWEFSFGGCILFLIAGAMSKHLYDRAIRDRSIRHALLSIMVGWLAPSLVYAGFLHAWRTLLLVLPFYYLTCWYASMKLPEKLPTLRDRVVKRPNMPAPAIPNRAARLPVRR